jgi:hypothetical protein
MVRTVHLASVHLHWSSIWPLKTAGHKADVCNKSGKNEWSTRFITCVLMAEKFFSSSRDVTVAGTAARRSARLERETHSYLAATDDIVAVVRHLFAPLLSHGKSKIKEEILRNREKIERARRGSAGGRRGHGRGDWGGL